jgi:hypothetical protein
VTTATYEKANLSEKNSTSRNILISLLILQQARDASIDSAGVYS